MPVTDQEILDGLTEIIVEETGLPASSIQTGKKFVGDLDIDSLSMMTIVVNVEDKFDVRIPDDAVKDLKTVGDAVEYIRAARS